MKAYNARSSSMNQEPCELILTRFDWYITTHARWLLRRDITDGYLCIDIEELIQRVRIKLWHTLERNTIRYPHSYIRRMVHNECVDMKRQQKVHFPLPTDDDEERFPAEIKERLVLGSVDPAEEVEQQAESLTRLKEAVQLVLNLPARQRLAMICSLKDRVDDPAQLIASFKEYNINIEGLQWPADKAERQLLQASLFAARHTLAKNMAERNRNTPPGKSA